VNSNTAPRNKTITISEEELRYYVSLCPTGFDSSLDSAVINGDTFEVLRELPDRFIDLMVADPPYNLTKQYAESSFRRISDAEYAEFTRKWIQAAKHTLKPHAAIYVCSDWRSGSVIADTLAEFFTLRNRITWQREKGRGTPNNWKNSMEDIWYATVSPKRYTFNADDVKIRRRVLAPYREDGQPRGWSENEAGKFRDTYSSNFWDDISVPFWSMPENTGHPAQKPEKLIAKLILASSNRGDIVLDPFSGSGTTAVVAKKLGRRYMCIERERQYCALTQKRLEIADSKPAIQGYEHGVFWERNTTAAQRKK